MSQDNVSRMLAIIGPAGYETFIRAVGRMTNGSYRKSLDIARNHFKHYNIQVTDYELDCLFGELNCGVEIEWAQD